MQRAGPYLSSVWSLAHSRRMPSHAESKRGGVIRCLYFLKLVTTHHWDQCFAPAKNNGDWTLTRVSSIHGSCFEAATLPNHNLLTNCQMFLKLFSATVVLNPNTVRFEEEQKLFEQETQFDFRLGQHRPWQTRPSSVKRYGVKEQILVLHILRSGCRSIQRS